MGTPKKGYFLADGTQISGVTTILGRFKHADPLMYWSWQCGMRGEDYRKVRDKAATAGTMAHEAIEAWKKGLPFDFEGDDPLICERARRAFGAFLQWADQTKLKITHAEVPLISEKYRFGGTFDAILVNGRRAMGDWKTSGAIYGEYLAQIAAYGKLWEENYPNEPIDGGFYLLRFDKEYGDFHAHWWGELDAGWRFFLALRNAYEEDKELKQRAKG